MLYELTAYSIAQLLTGLVAIAVSIIIWKRRNSRGGWPLFLLFMAVSEWALCNGLEAAAVPLDLKIFWSKMVYLGAQTSPVLLVLFALQFGSRGKRVTHITLVLFFLIPLITILLAATNEMHGLIWDAFTPGPPGTNSLIYHHGPAFWISVAYIFVMVSVGTAVLLLSPICSQKVYREQSRIILIASIIPWIGFLIYVLDLNPFPGLDTVSISFLFTGLVLAWGMFKSGFLDIVPIAYELIYENVKNGILTIDERMRIIDINPAAAKLLSIGRNKNVGAQIQTLEGFWKKIENYFDKTETKRIEISTQAAHKAYLDVHITPLRDQRKRFLGWVVILDDISTRKRAEKDLRAVNKRLKQQLGEIRELQDQLHEQAMRDPVTGIYNRRFLKETLSREISRALRNNYPLSIIMLDIDFFKKINDTYGHKGGDDVIIALSKLLQSETRGSDCVSRYGGDEFVLVMPEMTKESAFHRAELWRNAVKTIALLIGENSVNISVSMGIATFPENGMNSDALLIAADEALYQAKATGRDRTCLAE